MSKLRKISIKNITLLMFILFMTTTLGTVGFIVFSKWMESAEEIAGEMAEDLSRDITRDIEAYIGNPESINLAHEAMIRKGIVDIYDPEDRERFFLSVLGSYSGESIYSFSFGTENGEYYGARRNPEGGTEVMRNDAGTEGNSWYYSVTDSMRSGDIALKAGKFDPRTRAWYIAAKEAGGSVFSPIYKHFVIEDMTLSAALPVYNDDGSLKGVLGTHMTLGGINSFLSSLASERGAKAAIIEKDTGLLVANSTGSPNFTVKQDGTLDRITLQEIGDESLAKAWEYSSGSGTYGVDLMEEDLHVHYLEFARSGIDWMIVTTVPSSLFTAGILENMRLTGLYVLAAFILSTLIYLLMTRRLLGPIDSLIATTVSLSEGDLSKRATVFRDDEIGRMASSFNDMADTINELFETMEHKVYERTQELAENKDRLQLILNSTVEAIFGSDIEGNCIFCNEAGIRILGYENQDELLGRNLHDLTHHSTKDGNPIRKEDCRIQAAAKRGEGIHSADEVFWRKDGTLVEIEYYAYPQIMHGEIVGIVVTFMDNSAKKRDEEKIRHLSYHDSLTGLYNRKYLEDEIGRMDVASLLPISVIYGDVNGLKLSNDIFGHTAGDELLKKSAEILKSVIKDKGMIARVGGDEFMMLLPRTTADETLRMMDEIRKAYQSVRIDAIKTGISMGFDICESASQSFERTMANAEFEMYKEKTLSRKTLDSDMVSRIIMKLFDRSDTVMEHSFFVSEMCQRIGRALQLSDSKSKKLRDAGFLHDIGKVVFEDRLLERTGKLDGVDRKAYQQHVLAGYRILNSFEDTAGIAEAVLAHHERWDGTGYPRGLSEEEIPLLSRIIAVAEGFDQLKRNGLSDTLASLEMISRAGTKYDPRITRIFIEKVLELDLISLESKAI
ncbi:HD domain-containing phosphohydrolase [Youngiibacter multivorans]|uniref:Diguanylate cyclase (GGDEF)-like protein/PAS domain S-box-containing protein/putative nucleotidyltransferase with HDIG domain n=1 Tax=Youngiibacter multivorans TaxID=937251 RepID=A0ABS4G7N4_9CLOT|nr:HD domain-containing phosphohydrolase [Youngiibacter multivorans]MBP1920577.1 diguanylate cyclase (GGDEF)-like protein/PAS domain S-box-containing protein/putative nucleotidyltransferase with HDIG domain [Youngiibacter multivorans]